jgi:hypothetical protein
MFRYFRFVCFVFGYSRSVPGCGGRLRPEAAFEERLTAALWNAGANVGLARVVLEVIAADPRPVVAWLQREGLWPQGDGAAPAPGAGRALAAAVRPLGPVPNQPCTGAGRARR